MKALDLEKSLKLAEKFGVKVADYRIIKNKFELRNTLFDKSVMKAISSEAIHKTEMKAIELNITTIEQAEIAFDRMKKIHGFVGIILQEQIEGIETIIGSKRDSVFGPIVLAGLGGIFTEIMKDVSIRISPLTKQEAKEMFTDLKGHKMLEGYRGRPKADLDELSDIVLKVSKMMEENETIEEFEFNPVMCNENGCFAVDARGAVK